MIHLRQFSPILMLFLAAVLTACAAPAPEREALTLDERLADLGYRPGEQIDRLSQYRISDWNYLDNRHFLFSSGPTHAYLISLKSPCTELRSVENIAFRTRTESLTPFDDIIVPTSGVPRYCAIENIQKLYRQG